MELTNLYIKLIKLGIDPAEVQESILDSVVNYWAYQDFNVSPASNTVTLTLNENQTTPSVPVNIQDSTAVLSTQDGKPYGVFLINRRTVSTHTSTTVTFSGNVSGTIRVWWLQRGAIPAGMTIAPKFVKDTIAVYMDEQYVNQVGDESIDGVKTFTGIPKVPTTTPTVDEEVISKKHLDDVVITTNTVTFSGGRYSTNATDIYLNDGNGIPLNLTPYIIPFDCTLIFISASTDGSETWTAEIHKSLVLVSGATIPITTSDSEYVSKSIDFSAGDKISFYCNGSGINKPRITAVFKRR